MPITFAERAQGMGLNTTQSAKGLYSYEDRYGSVVYRQLACQPSIVEGEEHPTDGTFVPIIGIFTKTPTDVDYAYAGSVSNAYKFIGNDVLNERIRQSIREVGMPIIRENAAFWDTMCRMRNEMILEGGITTPQAGDILPVIIVNNSYNGMRAATLSFGLALKNDRSVSVFGFSLGEMRQIHIASSNTQLSSAVASYMQVFTQDIQDMITQSFNTRITEQQMLSLLDVIEGIGKKRADKVSSILKQLNPPQEVGAVPQPPSSWQLFLALVRYSSLEPNLNIRRLLENAAESVLVIPGRMFDVLEKLQK
jgi:hypothetical protein